LARVSRHLPLLAWSGVRLFASFPTLVFVRRGTVVLEGGFEVVGREHLADPRVEELVEVRVMWDQTARAGLQLPRLRDSGRAYRNSGNCRTALRRELPEELPQKLVTQPDARAYYSTMRCFGIEPPSSIQVVHQVNHHSDASACPTKYFDLIPCQVALRARDANGGGFVFDCSAHARTCLLGNIIAYTPYAFDINNFVYAHLRAPKQPGAGASRCEAV